ncbi:Spy/CpxP family protein refolding chaperone [Gloeocapsa sp. PCC 73106]|uniref:Spy/CpxP family protein refolding chaperone n=1 Tax=Gloeocapsa sp. PCC 73106 TaxID=102232 RepID=UPI0002ABEA93|nr:Spy/CpxP family protein refolding chaperone [Gloeocapsa sp. PCC 73106]ELR99477.1 hypothetical protein GLO73106DRAFT_00033290 [Gloeocapsa sp. PCC 73106]
MKRFSSLVAIALQMLILPSLNPKEVLAEVQNPLTVAQTTEVEVVDLTIDPPLTPEQEAKLQEIDTMYRSRIKEAANQYIESLKAIDQLLGTNPTNELILERYSQAQSNRNNVSNLLLERLLEFRSVLTPEQQASLSDDIRSYLQTQPDQ